MREAMPIVLVPGLNCSTALYAEQLPALWRFGPVQIADHTRDDSMAAIATRILDAAPQRRCSIPGRAPTAPSSASGVCA